MNIHPIFFLNSNSPHFATDSRCGQMFDIAPLSFDRVHPGHVASSAFLLFKMPVELFHGVTRYLSKRDLENLALVDRDCCRLAALGQYKTLRVETTSTKFYPEAQDSLRPFPSYFSECVRELNIIPPPLVPKSSLPDPGTDIRDEFFDSDGRPTQWAPSVTQFFPNIHILNWDGPSFTSTDIIKCIRASSIKHLRLRGTLMDLDGFESARTETTSCHLETLSLDIDWHAGDCSKENLAFIEDLFRIAAPHLRQLVWKGHRTHFNTDFSNPIPIFPNLRSLILDSVTFEKEDGLCVFFGDHTHINLLSVDASSVGTRNFLRTSGRIPTLQHFSSIYRLWTQSRYLDLLDFLSHNDQLETVHIAHPIHHSDMNLHLMPMLHQHFDVLTSLRLTFEDSDIPQQSLQAISVISTLRRLWLSAGDQGYRSAWVIRHDDIFKCLKSLNDIEILAFSQDTYVTNVHPLAPRMNYYANKALPIDLDITAYQTSPEMELYQGRNVDYETDVSQQAQIRDQAWERWHAECMLTVASNYS